MLNKVVLQGRLVADPEVRQTPSGISVATFRVACDRNYQPQGGERQADFISCVAWRQTGEFIGKYFPKGTMILVEGAIQTRNYEDKNGNKRTAVEVIVDRAYFCGAKVSQPGANQQSGYQPQNGYQQTQNGYQAPAVNVDVQGGMDGILGAARSAGVPVYEQTMIELPDDGDLPF